MQTLKVILFALAPALLGWSQALVTVEGSLNRSFDATPGAVYEDSLEVGNPGDADAEIRIYLTDYTFSADGTVHYDEPGTLTRSNSSWISLSAEQMTIPAGSSVTIPYRVTIPDDELTGSYWSMIMVEEVSPAPGAAAGAAINTVVRYGVQVLTTAETGAESELRFVEPVFARNAAGSSVLQVDIRNTGNLALRARHYVDLFDARGNSIGRVQGDRLRTYPGTSIRQRFDLGELAPGTYLAIVVADAGGGDVFGAQYNLNVDEDD